MSQTLSRWQAVLLGLVVMATVVVGGVGLTRVAARQGLWADAVEVTVGLPDTHDIRPGTPVRVRGVDAGQVVAVEYPDTDGPGSVVVVRLRLDARFAGRLYADGSARVHPTGLLGGKVIAVDPGTPAAGSLTVGTLRAEETPDFTRTAAKLEAVAARFGEAADETKQLVREVRQGDGTIGKLVKDDELYADLKGLARDGRAVLKRADGAIGTVEAEAGNVRTLVADGRDTLRSVKQGTDAVQKLPVIRGYVEDRVALLTRPDCRREAMTYDSRDLFEPGSAILSVAGREHLTAAAKWVRAAAPTAEAVVAARSDPADTRVPPAAADELTRKQAEAVAEFLKGQGAHRLGWWSRRPLTPVGLGSAPPPVPDPQPVPPAGVQVLLFTPAP